MTDPVCNGRFIADHGVKAICRVYALIHIVYKIEIAPVAPYFAVVEIYLGVSRGGSKGSVRISWPLPPPPSSLLDIASVASRGAARPHGKFNPGCATSL